VFLSVTRPPARTTFFNVRRFNHRILVGLGVLLAVFCAAGPVRAQSVEIASVKFNNVRAPNGTAGTWLEGAIVLNAKPAPGSPGQMVPRVRVALLLAFELPALAGGERRLEYYHAEAECVALEPGRAEVRFYLPPEVVKRDQLHGDPKYWGIELSVEGKPIPAGRAAYAATLAGAEQRKNFQKRVTAAAGATDGILLPQYLTPFVNEYPRVTPSFVRKEAR
jgi:hypothetical protein